MINGAEPITPEIIPVRNTGGARKCNSHRLRTGAKRRKGAVPFVLGNDRRMRLQVAAGRAEMEALYKILVERYSEPLPPVLIDTLVAIAEAEISRRWCWKMMRQNGSTMSISEKVSIRQYIDKLCDRKIKLKKELKLGLISRAEKIDRELKEINQQIFDEKPTPAQQDEIDGGENLFAADSLKGDTDANG
jgi:hypothetical protein